MRRYLNYVLCSALLTTGISCSHPKTASVGPDLPGKKENFLEFGASTEVRTPAQQQPLSPLPMSMRFYPFFIEALPSNTDPRTGNLNISTAPISADQLQRIMAEGMAPLMSDLSGAYFIGSQSLNDLLLLSAQHIQTAITNILERVDESLVDQDTEYSLVLLPWKQSDPFHYTTSAVQVTGRISGSSAFGKPTRFYEQVENNLKELQAHSVRLGSAFPVYFLGAIMNIHLKKNSSSIKTQLLLGLNPAEIPFSQANDQVSFSHLVVPQTLPIAAPPVMSVQFNQSVRAARTRPTMNVEFGPLKGWNPSIGKLKIELGETRSLCDGRSSSTPYLKGQLGARAVGNATMASAIQGLPVNFYLYDLNVDLLSSRVTTMNLAIGAGFRVGGSRFIFGCVNAESIDQQFQSEVNKTIESQVQQLQSQDPAKIIQSLLNQQRGAIR